MRAGETNAAATELIRAQSQNPALPHTWFALGLIYKHSGDYAKALEQFRQLVKLAPAEPVPHYNLALLVRSTGNPDAALTEFLEAERLNPALAGPHFQLYKLYERMGRHEDALRELKAFEDAKQLNERSLLPEDMEWSRFVELYDPAEPRRSAVSAWRLSGQDRQRALEPKI